MSDDECAREAEAEHVQLKLAQGLKACRAMVDNYRLMLGGAANDNGAEEQPAAFRREADEV